MQLAQKCPPLKSNPTTYFFRHSANGKILGRTNGFPDVVIICCSKVHQLYHVWYDISWEHFIKTCADVCDLSW